MAANGRQTRIGSRVCQNCSQAVMVKDMKERVRCKRDQWVGLDKSGYTLSLAWFMRWVGAPFRRGTKPREPHAERCIFYEPMSDD